MLYYLTGSVLFKLLHFHYSVTVCALVGRFSISQRSKHKFDHEETDVKVNYTNKSCRVNFLPKACEFSQTDCCLDFAIVVAQNFFNPNNRASFYYFLSPIQSLSVNTDKKHVSLNAK